MHGAYTPPTWLPHSFHTQIAPQMMGTPVCAAQLACACVAGLSQVGGDKPLRVKKVFCTVSVPISSSRLDFC